ncbi:MAG: HlyD family efflux transporter periplasmic adaptor subunit [Candidatus Promineifilaceae bacterium]|nr:HlyD family efflux transporter periplasmic adaptor subunit [Candidatus Promineifilaceae bacterium]
MRRFIIVIGLLLALSVGTIAVLQAYSNGRNSEVPTPIKPVTVPVSRGDVVQTVTAPGQLVGTQERVLGVDINGRLLELRVRPGSSIKAGDIIARLDPAPYEADLEVARIELAEAEAAYRQQLAEAELSIAAGEAQVESTQAQIPSLAAVEINLQAARDTEARAAYEYQKAQDREWEPPEVVEAYRLEWENTVRAVELAEAEYNRVRAAQWSVSQQVNALAKNVEQSNLQAQYLSDAGVDPMLWLAVDKAQEKLAQTLIKAPFDGVVLDVFARPGEQLASGSNLVLLTDPAQGEVRTTVIEEDLSMISVGQAAEIFFDARPDVLVNGQVSRIVPQRVVGEARPLYHVYLSLTDSIPEGVYPGMTADASLLIDRAQDVLRLPRALVATRSDGTATVEIWENDRRVDRDIAVGIRGDVYIAVLDGLVAGEEVIGE